MAGILKFFRYLSDDGNEYAVELDSSNASLSGFGLLPYLGNPILTRQPLGMRLRSLTAIEPDQGLRRRLVVGKPDCPAWLGQVQTVTLIDYNDLSDAPFEIVARIPERQFRPPRPGS